MKIFVSTICMLTFGLTVSAAENKNSKTKRNPANSSWVYCTAYSTDNSVGRIEFADSSSGNGPYVKVDGADAELTLLNFSTVKFKANGKETTLKFKEGKTELKEASERGDSRVYEISGQTDSKIKYFGICTSYNY